MKTFDNRIGPVGRRMLPCAKPLAVFFAVCCAFLAQADQSVDELRLKALDGDAVAAKELADLYYGDGRKNSTNSSHMASQKSIRRNRTEALKWYEKAASLGDVDAMMALVKRNLPLDRAARLFWLKRLVKKVENIDERAIAREELLEILFKSADCCFRLKDSPRTIDLLFKGCEKVQDDWEHLRPSGVVSALMCDTPDSIRINDYGGDYPACVRFLKYAIGRDLPREGKYDDNVALRVQMGDVYARGIGVAQDLDKSVKWYFEALDYAKKHGCKGRSVGLAQRRIGECLRYGKGRPANLVEAVTWYEKAALNRDKEARNQFAQWCADGLVLMDGEEVTEKEARRRVALDSSLESQTIVDVDLVRAEELSDLSDYWGRIRYEVIWRLVRIYMQRDEWNKIVDFMSKRWYYDDKENPFLGNMKYAFALAYQQGKGVEEDKAKYLALMREAAKLDCPEAMIHLDRLGIDYTDYSEAYKATPGVEAKAEAKKAEAKPAKDAQGKVEAYARPAAYKPAEK